MRKGVFKIIPIWMVLLMLICFVSVGIASRIDDQMEYTSEHNLRIFRGTVTSTTGEPILLVDIDFASSTTITVATSSATTTYAGGATTT